MQLGHKAQGDWDNGVATGRPNALKANTNSTGARDIRGRGRRGADMAIDRRRAAEVTTSPTPTNHATGVRIGTMNNTQS